MFIKLLPHETVISTLAIVATLVAARYLAMGEGEKTGVSKEGEGEWGGVGKKVSNEGEGYCSPSVCNAISALDVINIVV